MRTLGPLALIAVFLTLATTASARIPIRVGIGDQSIAMFDQSAFQRAKFERVRFLVPWNVMDNAGYRYLRNVLSSYLR